jgi:hypothetical protein
MFRQYDFKQKKNWEPKLVNKIAKNIKIIAIRNIIKIRISDKIK